VPEELSRSGAGGFRLLLMPGPAPGIIVFKGSAGGAYPALCRLRRENAPHGRHALSPNAEAAPKGRGSGRNGTA
jgi:hypothetical protein